MKTSLQFLMPVIALCACSALDDGAAPGASVTAENVPHDMIVLGDRLEDPYSVSNIEAALVSLYPSKAGRIDLKPTDIYVRFLPRNETEYDSLVSSGIHLTDHPLDYEIVREGDY